MDGVEWTDLTLCEVIRLSHLATWSRIVFDPDGS